MNIYLIRHGRTDWNDQTRLQGQTDTELNLTGIREAELTALSLRDLPLEIIYCSDLQRAVQTTNIINRYHQTKISPEPTLKELNFGSWEGKTWNQIKQEYTSFIPDWQRDRLHIPAPGGETLQELAARLTSFIFKLPSDQDQHIAVVTHGVTLKILICLFLDLDPAFHSKFTFTNCSISHIQYQPDSKESKIIFLNEATHLKTLAQPHQGLETPANRY